MRVSPDQLRGRISSLSNEKLVLMASANRGDYTPQALEIARWEADKRGILREIDSRIALETNIQPENYALPETLDCPHCGVTLMLDDQERINMDVRCPECREQIDFSPGRRFFASPFSFEGRIGKAEYALSWTIYLLTTFAGGAINEASGIGIGIVLIIPAFWFILAQGAKRCHDMGNGWFYQIIPFYGLLMLLAAGDKGWNNYGLDPRGVERIQVR